MTQRYAPSCRLSRYSTRKASFLAFAARKAEPAISRSSGWTESSQPRSKLCSGEVPVKWHHRSFR